MLLLQCYLHHFPLILRISYRDWFRGIGHTIAYMKGLCTQNAFLHSSALNFFFVVVVVVDFV